MSYYLDYKYPFQPSNLQGNITTNKVKDKKRISSKNLGDTIESITG